MQDIKGMVDKRAIHSLLGCYANNPKLLTNEKYEANRYFFNEEFHRTLWGAMYNIAKKSKVEKITAIEIETELAQFPIAMSVWNDNKGREYLQKAIDSTRDKVYNVDLYFDTVKKYSIIRNAQEKLCMDTSFIYDEEDEGKLYRFLELTSDDVRKEINMKFLDFNNTWKSEFSDNRSLHIGENLDELLDKFKKKDEVYGFPFSNAHLNTIFRGMNKKKFLLRSSKSGGGKSRLSMIDAVRVSTDSLYDWKNREWVNTGDAIPSLLISIELMEEEIQSFMLAVVSGIEQDRLEEWRNITEEEEKVIEEAKDVLRRSKLFIEIAFDFTIDSIKSLIEEYVINENIEFLFYDYINESYSLLNDYNKKAGTKLQTHQVLYMFSMELKALANKYNLHLSSSTQLSANYKEEKDANSLKGSKSIADKVDIGIIALPATFTDLKKLDPIMKSGFYPVPNYSYCVYKNRGNKYTSIVVWTNLNLGNGREEECFVTDMDYKLVDVEKTTIGFSVKHDKQAEFVRQKEEISSIEITNSITGLHIEE